MWELDHKGGRRIDAFERWCWRRFSPFSSKENKAVNPIGKQPWIFIDAEAEAPIFLTLMQRAASLEKTLMQERLRAGGEGCNRGWAGLMASSTQCLSKTQEIVKDRESLCVIVHGVQRVILEYVTVQQENVSFSVLDTLLPSSETAHSVFESLI